MARPHPPVAFLVMHPTQRTITFGRCSAGYELLNTAKQPHDCEPSSIKNFALCTLTWCCFGLYAMENPCEPFSERNQWLCAPQGYYSAVSVVRFLHHLPFSLSSWSKHSPAIHKRVRLATGGSLEDDARLCTRKGTHGGTSR